VTDRGRSNSERVLNALAAFGRDLDEARSAFSDDLVHHVPGRGPLAGEYRGLDSFMGLLALAREPSCHSEQLVAEAALGDDVVVMLLMHVTAAPPDGRRLDIRHAYWFRMKDGKVVEGRTIPDDLYAFDEFWSGGLAVDH
jgi:ketosteroid isomerase-like protein